MGDAISTRVSVTLGLLMMIMAQCPAGAPAAVIRCAAGQNCTTVLQSALDLGGEVELRGVFTVRPVFIARPATVLRLARGALLRAEPGAFHGTGDCLVSIKAVGNVSVVGYGARLQMRRGDYANMSRPSPGPNGVYSKSEHRHAISIMYA